MQPVKDSIHDYIRLDELGADLIDTPTIQRLRHIKQLSTVRLVFPAANHTRFEHSLGVYHLAQKAVAALPLEKETARHVRAAAFLHDAGHGPYGHQTEDLIRRRTGLDHDQLEWLLTDPDRPVTQVLCDHGLDPARVAALIAGEGRLGTLVSGELDVDRMDYLVRDAHHTGVPYGAIDHERLVRALRLVDDELVLDGGNVQTAESLLVARSLMNGVVYRHHVSRIAGAMLERACELYLDRTDRSIEQFRRLADHDLLVELGHEVPQFGRRIEYRDLYKRAVWARLTDVPTGLAGSDRTDERTAAREIAAAAGVDREAVLVDLPDSPSIKESATSVVVDDTVERLEDVSSLVSGIRAAERGRWRLGVYAPAEHADVVASAAETILGLTQQATTGPERE